LHRSDDRGFTLIELVIVVMIIGVMAALAYSYSRAQARNIHLYQAVGELQQRAIGLRSQALSDGNPYLMVVVDAPNNDASQCGWWNSAACTTYYVLYSPAPGWTLGGFDPANPTAQASLLEKGYLPRGARLYKASSYHAPPTPFDKVNVFDSSFYGTCANGASCFAVRFLTNGNVRAELPGGGAQPTGLAFVLASDAELEGAGGDHRGVVIGFPSGIVKTWPYAP
jgi:prepilin-type N-terminal cleavage/methylation domain-containing protein